MRLSNEIKAILDTQLIELANCLRSNSDIRKCMSLLPSIAFPIRALLDISQDPSDMFVALLVTQQLSLVQSIYDGNSNTWYDLNKENVQLLRTNMSSFVEDLKKGIDDDDEIAITNAVKTFFSRFHRLARTTTRDHVERD